MAFNFQFLDFLKKCYNPSFLKKGLYSVKFNPSNISRDNNPTIENITLLEYNPENFRVIFKFRVKFHFFNFLGLNSKKVIFQKCYIPMRHEDPLKLSVRKT